MQQKVRKGEELSQESLKMFLFSNRLISDAQKPLLVEQFTSGFSNLTYLLKIEDKELVLRRPPVGAIKRGHDMEREYRVLNGLNRGFTKAPEALAFCEDTGVIGAPFYIMEKVDGIILTGTEARRRNISPQEFTIISHTWLDTFVELHSINYEKLGLGKLGRPEGYVERQIRNWGKQYFNAATEEIPEAPKVIQWLDENQPKQYNHSLVHNDYKYDNVVFKDDSWQELSAVLDWEMCTLGDPLMDLGTSLAYWNMATDSPLVLNFIPSPTVMEGNPDRSDLVQMYAKKSGRDIDHLIFYFAYGLFKIAVIAQQIYFRYAKGLTTNPKFEKLNQATSLYTKMAWQSIQKNRIEKLL